MKVAVTGGAGFIGSHLADALLSEGHEVVIIDDLSSGLESNIAKKASFVRKDVRSDLSEELRGADTVFHLAADPDVRRSGAEPGRCFDINVRGTFSVLDSCRKSGVGRVVFASTSTVYGRPSVTPTPESHPCAPISNYGASKLAGESYLSAYCGSYGMRGTSLRFANIYGERSKHGVMHDFFRKLEKDPRTLEIFGDGKQDKSYLHVSDCVSGILAAWKGQKAGYDVFNVGSDEKVTVDGLAMMMCRLLGASPTLKHVPAPGGTEGGWAGDVRLMLLDSSKLGRLGWKPKTGLDEGLAGYLSCVKKNS